MKKAETKCQEQAMFRYTWPGQNEAFVCDKHALLVRRICEAMGFYVQLIPLTPDEELEHTCNQIVQEHD